MNKLLLLALNLVIVVLHLSTSTSRNDVIYCFNCNSLNESCPFPPQTFNETNQKIQRCIGRNNKCIKALAILSDGEQVSVRSCSSSTVFGACDKAYEKVRKHGDISNFECDECTFNLCNGYNF